MAEELVFHLDVVVGPEKLIWPTPAVRWLRDDEIANIASGQIKGELNRRIVD